jgi:hypothetical protein
LLARPVEERLYVVDVVVDVDQQCCGLRVGSDEREYGVRILGLHLARDGGVQAVAAVDHRGEEEHRQRHWVDALAGEEFLREYVVVARRSDLLGRILD